MKTDRMIQRQYSLYFMSPVVKGSCTKSLFKMGQVMRNLPPKGRDDSWTFSGISTVIADDVYFAIMTFEMEVVGISFLQTTW